MPILLPDLDDRSYADLLDEARALLPSLAPEWTSHNPSDPGITLVELFAWLSEMLVWRANQVPDASLRGFLKLLNGPGSAGGGDPAEAADPAGYRVYWREPGAEAWRYSRRMGNATRAPLDAEVRATLAGLREAYRAVTPADYERLATSAFNDWLAAARVEEAAGGTLAEWSRVTGSAGPPSRVEPIARARCVPRRHLGAANEADRARDMPGRVSVLVLPPRHDDPATAAREDRPPPPLADLPPPAAGEATRRALWGFLEERRLLGTRVHVVAPVYVPVRVEAVLVRRPDAPDPASPATLRTAWDQVPAADVRRGVLEAVAAWLDPLAGGPGGLGWPFGRDVHASDLYGVLEAVHGVDFIAELRLSSPCPGSDPGCVAAAEVRHPESGEQVGLALAAHHLPRARLAPEDVHVAAAAVPVRVRVLLTPAHDVDDGALEWAVERTVRRVMGGFGKGPNGDAGADVKATDVRAALRKLPEVDARRFVHVRFEADPARLLAPAEQEHQAVRFAAREIAAPELVLATDGGPLWL